MTIDESASENAEEIARRHAMRSGFRLVDYAEIGLPVYRMTLEAFFLAKKPMPPVPEFVLKVIDAGLRSSDEIGAFLGLEDEIVQDALATLVGSDDIYLAAPENSRTQVLSLTQKGRLSLEAAKLVVPEERSVVVYFDGLLRRPVPHQGWLLKSRDLKADGIKEIPPFPPTRPEADDLKVREVKEVLRQFGAASEYSRELLGLKAIERRELLFLPAIALIYKATEGDDIQVAFAIGGRLSSEHEDSFARVNGPTRLGIVEAVNTSVAEVQHGAPPDQSALKRQNTESIENLKRASSKAQSDVLDANRALDQAETADERKNAQARLRLATDKLSDTKAQIDSIPIRAIDVYEHPELLDRALTESKRRLLIISPRIRAKVVDHRFVAKLEKLLDHKVEVFIGYGLGENDDQAGDHNRRAVQEIDRLARKYSNLFFRKLSAAHANIVISDSKFAITTNFNWLSFRGDPHRTFRDQQGILVALPELVEDSFVQSAPAFAEGM